MAVLKSNLNTASEAFRKNRADMLAMLERVRGLEQKVRDTSNAKADVFKSRGQIPPRERIDRLLDKGSPFLELQTLAGLGFHDDDGENDIMGGGAIIGIGYVQGVRCMVNASDSGIKGGTITPLGSKKSLRAQDIALENKLPRISLVESGGANLKYQAELFVEGGKGFYNQAKLSAAGIPQITVVHGSSTAGGAYIPGMSDYTIMVKDRAKVFLAGPPLLFAATGEVATDEDLGGAEMHTLVSGVSEYMAIDDADGIRLAREIMGKLRWNDRLPAATPKTFREPLYDPDEICGLVPVDYRRPYDVRELIARLVDGSDFVDFKAEYGPGTVVGFAEIMGQAVGLIGNNGPIDNGGATKAAQFMQLCDQSDTPIVFLHNTTGFIVGTESERGGMVKHGSKMIQATSNVRVPKITMMIGASFGAGNYAMCGRAYEPRFIFGWPNYKMSVMGGEQAATVLKIVAEQGAKRKGVEPDHDRIRKMFDGIVSQFEREGEALYNTALVYDDGLIDPRDTRKVLGLCLDICREADTRPLKPNSFGVGRM
ncbi:acyl-CoA carboxylase subunit beta [Minwuia thermotolerans]|uniref:Acetyl-CoA carboxylase carboxyltransferase subunit n=1 Tax=Minwuia thermotolerans TaxID=2056226 RepID=A0A2M9G2Z2_9PROT|nr:carboxyl transferase domain-containing protein [Minwuia thermotolerans]PJK30089.1 acetyl-CoA carboxylase carboxyltransferase subunit [Minwuia thermotolerans]